MNILCIIEMEYLRGFTKSMQTNIDYIFILKDRIQINRQKYMNYLKINLQLNSHYLINLWMIIRKI